MSKHTPGPWIITHSRSGYPYQIDAPNGSRGPGGITSVTRWGAISCPSSEEGLANARLIAAAPELLQVVDLLIQYDEHDETEQSGADLWDEVMRLAHAAKAKAEGRT